MSCEGCRETEEKDGVAPPCRGGGDVPGVDACWIPPAPPEGMRAIELRQKAAALRGLLGAEAVIRACGATEGDLELMAVIEEELREEEDAENQG